jgi:glycosyltransferase involved in cell wall biosynthesis
VLAGMGGARSSDDDTAAHEGGAANTGGRPRLRVLHVTQPTTAGVGGVVRALAGRSGPLIATTVASPAEGELPGWCAANGVAWLNLPMVRRPALRDLAGIFRLRRLMKSHDVVHLHSSKAGALGRLAAVGLRRPPRVVFSPHAWSWLVGGRLGGAYELVERMLAQRADVIVAVSESEMIEGRRVLGSDVGMVVVPNGIDTAHFAVEGPRADRGAAPLIVTVGRLSHQKGQDRAIRLLAELPEAGATLRLVGDGPSRAELTHLAATLGVLSQVEFIGRTDPRPHVRAADVVLLPSRWEGLSLTLLECMSLGAPIIATAVGGTEVLSGYGVLVPHASEEAAVLEALKGAVVSGLSDPGAMRAQALLARQKVVAEHDVGEMVRAHERLWQPADVEGRTEANPKQPLFGQPRLGRQAQRRQ